jgi:hypothetical protein
VAFRKHPAEFADPSCAFGWRLTEARKQPPQLVDAISYRDGM